MIMKKTWKKKLAFLCALLIVGQLLSSAVFAAAPALAPGDDSARTVAIEALQPGEQVSIIVLKGVYDVFPADYEFIAYFAAGKTADINQVAAGPDGTAVYAPPVFDTAVTVFAASETLNALSESSLPTIVAYIRDPALDTDALKAAIADAESVVQAFFKPASLVVLSEALVAAKDTLADDRADQDDVDAAAAALVAAIEALEKLPSELDAVLENFYSIESETYNIEIGIYTEASVELLDDAIAFAADVLADPLATQDDVDDALEALRGAPNTLELKPEYAYLSELNALLLQVAQMNSMLYTDASWGALQAVVDSAWASIAEFALVAPLSAQALEAAIEPDAVVEVVAETAEEAVAEVAEEVVAEAADIADAELPEGPAVAEAAEVETAEVEAAELVPFVDVPTWFAELALALQEAIANLVFEADVPPAGAHMSGGVTVSRVGGYEYIVEKGEDATAEFTLSGKGIVNAGTINMRISFKADLYTPTAPNDLPFSITLGEDIAGDAGDVQFSQIAPVLDGYKTYSVYILADGVKKLTLGQGETLGTGTIANVSLKLDGDEMKVLLASLLVTRLNIVYYDSEYENGTEGIIADVALNPSVATDPIRFASRFDVNRDGAVNLLDVNKVREYLGKYATNGVWTPEAAGLCDLGGPDDEPDGKIDTFDLTLVIAKYELGI
jgi:hypothetical protein